MSKKGEADVKGKKISRGGAEERGWKECRLSQFITIKHGYAFKGTGITDEDTGKRLVTPGNFRIGGGFKESKFKYFRGAHPKEYEFRGEEIIVTMTDLSKETDALGYAAKVPIDVQYRYLHNQRVGLVQFLNDSVYPDFIYWLMRSYDYHWFIVGSASGTSIMHTSPTRIGEFAFDLPPLSEQRAIAGVLSSLDDKIDLLHRQNKTLEAMAEVLFRQWFFEEADEGWEERPLSSIANFLNGLACQKYLPKNDIERLPVLKIRELSNGISDDSDWADSHVSPEYIVESGDVIFAWSASLMVKKWDGQTCILNQHLFKVTSEKFPKWYYYLWCKHHLDEFISISSSHATTMGHIKRGDIDNVFVLVPAKIELEKMTKIMTPILEKVMENSDQLILLEKLRDNLLPKLMSGEVRLET